MPGWHARTKDLVDEGKLRVAGITEEQHPDRTALFMQWQEMDWPVMLDSLNLLDVSAVPITLLIDEHGIIRYRNPKPEELTIFIDSHYEAPTETRPALEIDETSPEHAVLWGSSADLDRAIDSLKHLVNTDPRGGRTAFRLGVAYRKRFDSAARKPGDFGAAVAAWRRALEIDPNQYIWRRRIQQYGPRLDKPYSFYDWIHEARETIRARGEEPHPLIAEPSGAEFASPDKADPQDTADAPEHPDPDGKVTLDDELIRVETTAVGSTQGDGSAYRIHLRFVPDPAKEAHWNNEVGPLSLFNESKDVEMVDLKQTSDMPKSVTSSEERLLEFEARPKSGEDIPEAIEIAAFYYVCEGAEGTCLYRRQNLRISLP